MQDEDDGSFRDDLIKRGLDGPAVLACMLSVSAPYLPPADRENVQAALQELGFAGSAGQELFHRWATESWQRALFEDDATIAAQVSSELSTSIRRIGDTSWSPQAGESSGEILRPLVEFLATLRPPGNTRRASPLQLILDCVRPGWVRGAAGGWWLEPTNAPWQSHQDATRKPTTGVSPGPQLTLDVFAPPTGPLLCLRRQNSAALQAQLIEQLRREAGETAPARDVGRTLLSRLADALPLFTQREREWMIGQSLELWLDPLGATLTRQRNDAVYIHAPCCLISEYGGAMRLEELAQFHDYDHLTRTLSELRAAAARVTTEVPHTASLRLTDGTEATVVYPPLAPGGPVLTAQCANGIRATADDLVRQKLFAAEMAVLLEAAIKGRLNVMLCGRPGMGMPSLIRILLEYALPTDRVLFVREEGLFVRVRSDRPPEEIPPLPEGLGDVIARAVAEEADRSVVGPFAGQEVTALIRALDGGAKGWLICVNATDPEAALLDLEIRALRHQSELTRADIHRAIASRVDLVAHLDCFRLRSISEPVVVGNELELRPIFHYRRVGFTNDKAVWRYAATGREPRCAATLGERGVSLPPGLFVRGDLPRE